MMRTIKEEVIWINEFTSLEEAQEVIGQWIEEDYNQFYPHSKLGYKSPQEFEKQYYELQGGRALNLYTCLLYTSYVYLIFSTIELLVLP